MRHKNDINRFHILPSFRYYILFFVLDIVILHSFVLSFPAYATKMRSIEVTCPDTEEQFYTRAVGSTNNFGGVDLDFLQRAAGSDPLPYNIWTCPSNGFSAFSRDFEDVDSIPDAIKNKLVKPELTNTEQKSKDSQLIIPFWLKIENAALFYEYQQKDSLFMGDLYLLGSWLARLEKLTFSGGINEDFIPCIKSNLQSDDGNNEITVYDGSRFYYKYATSIERCLIEKGEATADEVLIVADYYRQSGEYKRATEWLKLLHSDDLPEGTDKIALLIQKEREFQQKALSYYQEVINGTDTVNIKSDLLCNITYLVGELNRRLGKLDIAQEYFARAMNFEGRTEGIQSFIEAAQNRMNQAGIDTSRLVISKNETDKNKVVQPYQMEYDIHRERMNQGK